MSAADSLPDHLEAFLVAFVFCGVDDIAVELEEPFGADENDVNVEMKLLGYSAHSQPTVYSPLLQGWIRKQPRWLLFAGLKFLGKTLQKNVQWAYCFLYHTSIPL